jgi:sodium/potassium-transporting ATPase subunit alpha
MGASGTDVAREAADTVLLDDNCASIAAGGEEGGAVFANMQKLTNYVLASNIPELVPFLGVIQDAWSLFVFFPVLVPGGWHWGRELAEHSPLYRSASGITLATIILMQIGNVVGRRSLTCNGLDCGLLANRILLLGVTTEIIFSWGVPYFPPVQKFLQTGSVAWQICALAWLGIPLIFLIDYAGKRILVRWR